MFHILNLRMNNIFGNFHNNILQMNIYKHEIDLPLPFKENWVETL